MANRKKSNDFIDIHALLSSYVSKWYIFVASIVICLTLGYLYTRMYKQNMAVRANVLINQEQEGAFGATSGGSNGLGALFGSDAYVEDEIFLISSHSLYREVGKTLGLNRTHYVKSGFLKSYLAYPDFPIDVRTEPGVADTLNTTIVFKIKVGKDGLASIKVKEKKNTLFDKDNLKLPYNVETPFGTFAVFPTSSFPKGEKVSTTIAYSGYEAAAESLTDQVVADIASRKSNVISLGIDTPYPAYGSAVLNEVIAQYNKRGIIDKNLQGEQTASFLEDRISLIGNDLDAAEMAIQNYKNSHNITSVSTEAAYQQGKRGAFEAELFAAEREIEMLKLTKDFFADSLRISELVPTTVANGSIQGAISEYNGLVLTRLRLLSNATPDNPIVRETERKLAIARKALLQNVDQALVTSQFKYKELLDAKAKTDSKLGNVPVQEREYMSMRRQQAMKEHLYTFLLERREENSMMLANATPKGKIIDEAFTLSTPLGMSKKIILLVALFMGLIIPPVLLYLWKLIRNKVETRQELEHYVSAPVLGEICTDRSGRKLVVGEHDTSSVTELFRLLRVNLRFMLSDISDKVVLVTSTVSGEGKSFISSNLAASLSLDEGKRVLLVGMDIRNPQLENYLDLHPKFGLTNYLSSSDVSLDQIIVKMPGFNNLDVIVAGPIPPNPAELLASSKVKELFEKLRSMYDYIVVDSAPVGMVSDTFTLNAISDATVYVTRVNYTSITDLRFIEDIYEDNRLKKLSVVVNGTASKRGYGYGYGRKAEK